MRGSSECVLFMGTFETAWGYSYAVPYASKVVVSSGLNWEVWQRTVPTIVGLAFDGVSTQTKVLSTGSEAELEAWARGVAKKEVVVPAKTEVLVSSSPSTARVYWDGKDTGRYTTHRFEATPGAHTIGLQKARYLSLQKTVTVKANQLNTFSYDLTREEVPPTLPPEVPPEIPPTVPPPAETPLGILQTAVSALLLPIAPAVVLAPEATKVAADFYNVLTGVQIEKASITDISRFAAQFLSLDLTDSLMKVFKGATIYRGEDPTPTIWDWIAIALNAVALIGALKALIATTKAVQATGAAGKISAAGFKIDKADDVISLSRSSPDTMKYLYGQMDDVQKFLFHKQLVAAGGKAYEASSHIARMTLPAFTAKTGKFWGQPATQLATVLLLWAGFQLTDLVYGLRKNQILPPIQADLLQTTSIQTNSIIEALESIKFSCDEKALEATKEDIADIEQNWLSLIKYAEENRMSPEQAIAFAATAASAIGIVPQPTSDAMLANIVASKKLFDSRIATELSAIQQKCKFGLEVLAEAELGYVTISIEPREALLRIAGWEKKVKTGDVISLPEAYYEGMLEAEGYKPTQVKLNVKAKQTIPLSVILAELPTAITKGAGRLQLTVYDDRTSAPITAALFIDGRLEPYTSHAYAIDLVPNAYEIRVEKAGYDFWKDTIPITEGIISVIAARLKKIPEPEIEIIAPPPEEIVPPEPEKGIVQVTSDPEAEIWIAGEDTGKTTPAKLELTQGAKDITLKAEGYLNETRTVWPNPDKPVYLAITMRETLAPPEETMMAKVSFRSYPPSAKISINGEFTGKYTPDYVYLEEGEYLVEITKSGYVPWSTPLKLVRE